MAKKLNVGAVIFLVMVMSFAPLFVNQVKADCQVGAFIADWAKNATFPWHGEQGIVNYENVIQKKVACVKIYSRIVNEFPFAESLDVYSHGTDISPTMPYIDIHPSTDAQVPILRDIINGDYDSYIQKWAEDAKAFGKPLWICFDGEMNGDWHIGSGGTNGGATLDGYGDPTKPDGPEVYIDAWRHIHDIFTAVGATNVAWVWSVNNSDWPREPWNKFQNYYPGDNYVDWLGVDGYNWNRPEYGGWMTFSQVFDNQADEYSNALNRLRAITTEKPIIIAEFACAHKPVSKKNWITDAFNLLKTNHPYVKCFIWFDMDKEENWLIDSDGNQAPRAALADSYFVSAGNPGTLALTSERLINAALNKSVTASSVEVNTTGLEPDKAVDGNYTTRWSSQNSDPQWIAVDLGVSYNIARVILNWEAAYGKSYKIQISDDGTNWTDVYSTTSGNGAVDNIPLNVNARYVRMYGTERGNTAWGYSLYEFGVYAPYVAVEQKMHISSINMSYKANRGGSKTATAKVKIVNPNGEAISGALVNGHWSGLTNDTDSVTTDSAGIATINSNSIRVSHGTFTFTVDSVSKDGWTYDIAANVETSDSVTF